MNRKYYFWGALLLASSLLVPVDRAESQPSFSIAQFELPTSGQTPARAQNRYPENVRTTFMTSCKQSATSIGFNAARAQQLCQCNLERLQTRYTLDQFTAIDRQIVQTGQIPQPVIDISMACARQLSN